MVLTRSMATTNDVQEEAPTTALERQVRTLAAAVERLTKQNHDLQEHFGGLLAGTTPVLSKGLSSVRSCCAGSLTREHGVTYW